MKEKGKDLRGRLQVVKKTTLPEDSGIRRKQQEEAERRNEKKGLKEKRENREKEPVTMIVSTSLYTEAAAAAFHDRDNLLGPAIRISPFMT